MNCKNCGKSLAEVSRRKWATPVCFGCVRPGQHDYEMEIDDLRAQLASAERTLAAFQAAAFTPYERDETERHEQLVGVAAYELSRHQREYP